MKILEPLPKGIKEFPTKLLNEQHAQKIHSQSLSRLDERGGMTYTEIIMNIFGLDIRDVKYDSVMHENLLKHIVKCV